VPLSDPNLVIYVVNSKARNPPFFTSIFTNVSLIVKSLVEGKVSQLFFLYTGERKPVKRRE
jgi:hypothetical protein